MRKTSAAYLAEAAGAKLLGKQDAQVLNVKIDSREAGSGDMFVCVVGEIHDGHRFAQGAYDGGCRVFLMSDPAAARAMLEKDDACVILTEDTNEAFRDMAKAYLAQFSVRKMAITGSVGKTSTRTFTDAVLAEKYAVVSSQKNLNTHLGLCLTCFLADETTEVMVFEMGMDRSGEIAEYVDWVRPEMAVITNVGITHLEKLGTRDAIADAKFEITKHFGADNLLICNADSDYLNEEEIRKRTGGRPFRLYFAGTKPDADLQLLDVKSVGEGIRFTLRAGDEEQEVYLPLLGTHNAMNAALAAAAGLQYGVDLKAAAAGLAKVKPNYRRLDARMLSGILLIDDTYNASPDSMLAALDVLDDLQAKRRIAVLADMLELGDAEEEGHRRVGRRLAASRVDVLYAIGPRAKMYAEELAGRSVPAVRCAEKLEELEDAIFSELREGDACLIKGSNITGVAEMAERLREKLGENRLER
ncbi:MAG: UDP-N-acetylmuramoyl-tripeptide--D-alanyl-D-alanine ligase [Clostridia bacterium]|nr:UDP-N-acetylmuramoyl-tripeptide--D-alanyl-D-alanine ligase [Clostridia bacterium]